MIPKMTHIAMRISDSELRDAEHFYCNLFRMDVAFRETMTPDGWATLPKEDGWQFADRHNLRIGLVMVYRGDFAIDLEARPVPVPGGRYSHTGIEVTSDELEHMREVVSHYDCEITHSSSSILVFDDPYGMRWEFMTLSYDKPELLSAGAREGRWAEALVQVQA